MNATYEIEKLKAWTNERRLFLMAADRPYDAVMDWYRRFMNYLIGLEARLNDP